MSASKQKSIDIVVDKLLSKINEEQTLPWIQEWTCHTVPYNYATGKNYQGINILLLWMLGGQYSDKGFLTFKQAQQLGAHVKKGEHGLPVVYASVKSVSYTNNNGVTASKSVWFSKSFTVFNKEQIEDLPPETARKIVKNINAEKIIGALKFNLDTTRNPAYSHKLDIIYCPERTNFKNDSAYYATLFHELIHWTGAEGRCNRKLIDNGNFGSVKYSFEELVAEIGASFLMSICGIWDDTEKNNAAYISSWLEILNNDKSMIIKAASKAQKAVDYILSFSKNTTIIL